MSSLEAIHDVPLNKLKPSPANVRKTATDTGIEELAASIAAHGLLQMPVVAPELNGDGAETGCYLVTAGERRRKALLLLVKQKKLKKMAPVTSHRESGLRCQSRRTPQSAIRLLLASSCPQICAW